MKSKHPDLSRATRRTPLVFALAAVFLIVLAGTVWAAWGAARSLPAGLSAWLDVDATATPTRTPRPVTVTPTPVLLDLVILAPAATPTPAPPASAPQPQVTPAPTPDWLDEVVRQYGMDVARRFIVIDLQTQKMLVWDPEAEEKLLRELPVSTGDESRGYRTPPWYGLVGKYEGTFQSFGVYADEGWYLFEDHGSILIHSAPYKLVAGQKVFEDMDALGAYPASHGCIRLAPEDAAWFTAWKPKGVPLVILPKDR
jgi:lipoprotein-anchoring transpeptidase ErfK/SrfK